METKFQRKWLTAEQAAEHLGISLTTLWRLRKTRKIANYSIRGKVLFDLADLEQFLNGCRQNAVEANR